MKELIAHPLANLFPLMEGAALEELAEDIKERGQLEPIVIHEGSILDGRNRYLACQMAGVEPKTVDLSAILTEHTPEEFVWSVNVERRQLTAGQRAAIALKFLPKLGWKKAASPRLTHSADTTQDQGAGATRADVEQVAEKLGTSPGSVYAAAKLQTEDPDAFEEVERGEQSLTAATKKRTKKERLAAKNRRCEAEERNRTNAVDKIASVIGGDVAARCSAAEPFNRYRILFGDGILTRTDDLKELSKKEPDEIRFIHRLMCKGIPYRDAVKLPEAPSFFGLSHKLEHLCAAWKRGDDYAPAGCCIERLTDGRLQVELDGEGWGFQVWRAT